MSRGMGIVVGAVVGGLLLIAGIVVGGIVVYAMVSEEPATRFRTGFRIREW